jgi:hypothetical protein
LGTILKRRYKIIICVLLAVMIVLVGFAVWAETPSSPMPEAFDALESGSAVNVSTNNWVIFQPTISNKNICFIIYPWRKS